MGCQVVANARWVSSVTLTGVRVHDELQPCTAASAKHTTSQKNFRAQWSASMKTLHCCHPKHVAHCLPMRRVVQLVQGPLTGPTTWHCSHITQDRPLACACFRRKENLEFGGKGAYLKGHHRVGGVVGAASEQNGRVGGIALLQANTQFHIRKLKRLRGIWITSRELLQNQVLGNWRGRMGENAHVKPG